MVEIILGVIVFAFLLRGTTYASQITAYELMLLTSPIDTAKFNVAYAMNEYYKITVGHDLNGGELGEIWFDMNKYSQQYKIPQMVLMGVMARESSFNNSAVNDGTKGIMQVTPGTTKDVERMYGIPYLYPPTIDSSIHAGAAYLHHLYSIYGDWKLTIEHYNGGHHMLAYYKNLIGCVEKFIRFGQH